MENITMTSTASSLLTMQHDYLAQTWIQLEFVYQCLFTIGLFIIPLGFMMFESGTVASVHLATTLYKYLQTCAVTGLFWYVAGYRIATANIVNTDEDTPTITDTESSLNFIYSYLYILIVGTIISNAVTPRMKLHSYLGLLAAVTSIIYPLGRQLSSYIGLLDYAGGYGAHIIGGMAALSASKIVGPRPGKYSEGGHVCVLKGGNDIYPIFGLHLVWFGWLSLTAMASQSLTVEGRNLTKRAILNTYIASLSAGAVSVLESRRAFKCLRIDLLLHGILGSLVAVGSCSAYIDSYVAILIGAVSIYIHRLAKYLLDTKWILTDDPMCSISRHVGNGCWGLIAVGLFHRENGVFTAGEFTILGKQLLAIAVLGFGSALYTAIYCVLIPRVCGPKALNYSNDDQDKGLDNIYGHFVSKEAEEALKQIETEFLNSKRHDDALQTPAAGASKVTPQK